MPKIEKLVLQNFRRFERLELNFDPGLNVLIGDNEVGKSTILQAFDLVLTASRAKVEAIGLETLFFRTAVQAFLSGKREVAALPVMVVEVYLSPSPKPDYNGKVNSKQKECDGLRMECSPSDDFSQELSEALATGGSSFPFEYYAVKFSTFSGEAYSGFRKHVRHLLLDSSRIDLEAASKEYTRGIFTLYAELHDRQQLEYDYRRTKDTFRDSFLNKLNDKLQDCAFGLRTGSRDNLESDLLLIEDGVPLDSKGRGRQCFVKTDFALRKTKAGQQLDVLLLEEPENHLSFGNMKRLVEKIAAQSDKQLFVATHSSLITTRLDLRKAVLLGLQSEQAALKELSEGTARFFMKAPSSSVLEFVLSRKVILVEGDAEYILIDAFYQKQTKQTLAADGIHVISVDGTSFKRYLELARLLGIRTAVLRDNDGDYAKNCVATYAEYSSDTIRVFGDQDATRRTFEVCVYQDNTNICESLFATGRRTLSVQEWMISNKTDAALRLLEEKAAELVVPAYVQEAITWIRQ